MSTEQQGIDLAMMDETSSTLFGKNGKFVATKDYPQLNNLKHIDPFWQDRCGAYATPYLWGTLGLLWRDDRIEQAPTSWNALLKPDDKIKGHISILKDSTDAFAPALIVNNQDINTADLDLLKQAFSITKAIMPHVLTLEYPITYVSANPKNNDLWLSVGYSGDQWAMNSATESEVWNYSVPSEGTILWVDCFAVSVNSPNKQLAYDFIDFINTPEINALNSEEIYIATSNNSAKKIQSAEFINDETVYPNNNIIKKSQFYQSIPNDNVRIRSRMASTLLKIHEAQ